MKKINFSETVNVLYDIKEKRMPISIGICSECFCVQAKAYVNLNDLSIVQPMYDRLMNDEEMLEYENTPYIHMCTACDQPHKIMWINRLTPKGENLYKMIKKIRA